jgi:hypothetical protein
MWGVRRARGFVGRERMLHPHPADRLVRQIMVEDVIGISKVGAGLNRPGVLIQSRMPLIGVASEKSIKVFEAQATRP